MNKIFNHQKKQKPIVIVLVIMIFLLTAFTATANFIAVKTLQTADGKDIQLEVVTGENFSKEIQILFFKVITQPQMTLWIEKNSSDKGRIDTLMVTKAFAKQEWNGLGKSDKAQRIESLPRWYSLYLGMGGKQLTVDTPLSDAITCATPKSSFILNTKISLDVKTAWIYFEVNQSLDYNDNYPENAKKGDKGYSATSGQPALLYAAEIDFTKPGRYVLKIIGVSNPEYPSDKVNPDTSSLTTALNIIKSAVIIVP